MDLSKVKLIVTDMDGTLLNSNHEVSDLFFEQFQILKANNIEFVAASGRQYYSILDKLRKIKKDITIVAENGAYVVKDDKELYVNSFETKDVLSFIKTAQNIPDVFIVLAGKKKAYFLKGNKELETLVSEYYSENKVLDSFDELPEDEILKIALYHPRGSEANVYPTLKHLAKDWQIKVSGEFWVDIALPTNHKGNALESIQKQMKITDAETMVFGDYMNDVEMLKKAKFSFAMENAHDNVKKITNYQTLSNDDLGVESVIAKLIKVI